MRWIRPLSLRIPCVKPASFRAGPGFTLVELLAVMGIIALLAGLVVPAFVGTSKARELGLAATRVSNLMAAARTEAITHNTISRLVIAENWPGDAGANFRKMSVWRYDTTAGLAGDDAWKQVSPWEELPPAIAFVPTKTTYVTESTVGDYLLEGTDNGFSREVAGKTVELKYLEFLPSGAARIAQGTAQDIWLTLAIGQINGAAMSYQGGEARNWAKISANPLTGRVRIQQP